GAGRLPLRRRHAGGRADRRRAGKGHRPLPPDPAGQGLLRVSPAVLVSGQCGRHRPAVSYDGGLGESQPLPHPEKAPGVLTAGRSVGLMDRRERFLDAIGEVGSDLIFDAETKRFAPGPLRRWGGLAAALVLVAGLTVLALPWLQT